MKKFRTLFTVLCLLSLLTGAAASAGEETVAHAVYWANGSVVVEGRDAVFLAEGKRMYPINLNGNIYVPMSTVAEWSQASAAWDRSTGTISFRYDYLAPRQFRSAGEAPSPTEEELAAYRDGLAEGFDVTLLPDVRVSAGVTPAADDRVIRTLNAQGQELSPILHQETIYLPIRTAAQVAGFSFWLREEKEPLCSTYTLYLYTTPSQAQLRAGRDYAESLDALILDLSARLDELERARDLTEEELRLRLRGIKDCLQQIKDLSIPSSPTLMYEVLSLHSILDYRIRETLDFYLREDLSVPVPRRQSTCVNILRSSLLPNLEAVSGSIRAVTDGMAAGMA